MPKGATLKQAKNYLEKAEATTFRKTKYSNIGKITKSVSKDSLFLYSIVYYTSIFFRKSIGIISVFDKVSNICYNS